MALKGSHKFTAANMTSEESYSNIIRNQYREVKMHIFKDKATRDTPGAGAEVVFAKVKLTKAEEDAIWDILYVAIKRDDLKYKDGWVDTDPK